MSLGMLWFKKLKLVKVGVKFRVIFRVRFERWKVGKKQIYMKTETYKLYSRVFWIFLPNVIKIDRHNFELHRVSEKSSTSYFAEYFSAGLTDCKNFNGHRVTDNKRTQVCNQCFNFWRDKVLPPGELTCIKSAIVRAEHKNCTLFWRSLIIFFARLIINYIGK